MPGCNLAKGSSLFSLQSKTHVCGHHACSRSVLAPSQAAMNVGRRGEPSHQPWRILVVDVQAPLWPHTCPRVCEALENVFSLAGSLAGPPRIPLLSIYAAQSPPECLLPFAVSPDLGVGVLREPLAVGQSQADPHPMGTGSGHVCTAGGVQF